MNGTAGLRSALVLALALVACRVSVPAGKYVCEVDADCPPHQRCEPSSATCGLGEPGETSETTGTMQTEPESSGGGSGAPGPAVAPVGSAGRGGADAAAGSAGPRGAGAGGLAAGSGGGGGGGGAGGEAAAGCKEVGAVRCAAAGGGKREQCRDGQWQPSEACAAGQVCTGPAASCSTLAESCRGSEGKTICDGKGKLIVCNPDGSASTSEACKSEKHCQAGLSQGHCPSCLPGSEYQCAGAKLEVCAADGTTWTEREDCKSAALCNELLGMCTMAKCAAGSVACQANTLVKCNADGSDFASMTPCGSGTCDAMGGDCNQCEPGTKACDATRDNVITTCDPTGQTLSMTSCSGSSKCVGLGRCVECARTADCGTGRTCQQNKCVCVPDCGSRQCGADGCGGTCGTCPGGTTCSAQGQCQCIPQCAGKQCGADGCGGTCGSCSNSQSCTAAGRCSENCGNGKLDTGEECDDANTADNDACIECKQARCGDGHVRATEQCDPTAPSWIGKCDNACKRTVYTHCNMMSDCSANAVCSAFVNNTTQTCGDQCSSDASCPAPGGFTATCLFGRCALQCNGSNCPFEMICVPNVPVPGMQGVTRNVCAAAM